MICALKSNAQRCRCQLGCVRKASLSFARWFFIAHFFLFSSPFTTHLITISCPSMSNDAEANDERIVDLENEAIKWQIQSLSTDSIQIHLYLGLTARRVRETTSNGSFFAFFYQMISIFRIQKTNQKCLSFICLSSFFSAIDNRINRTVSRRFENERVNDILSIVNDYLSSFQRAKNYVDPH